MTSLLIAVALLASSGISDSDSFRGSFAAESSEVAREVEARGDEVLAKALAAYLKRVEGVENYTIVQTVMGVETTVYFEKEVVDGRPRFNAHTVIAAGQRIEHSPDAGEDIYAGLEAYAGRTTLRGMETVDGHRTYALVVRDFSGMPGFNAQEMDDVEISSATLYLDADNYVLRRMEMEGTRRANGQPQPVTISGRFEDYREVRGMLHPFRTTMVMKGMASTLSEAEIEEARRNLEELKAQMENMPAAQRRMMESMLGPRIEQFEAMIGGEGVEMVIEVTDFRVNEGPPA
jgi:hypothetical protein